MTPKRHGDTPRGMRRAVATFTVSTAELSSQAAIASLLHARNMCCTKLQNTEIRKKQQNRTIFSQNAKKQVHLIFKEQNLMSMSM